MSESAPASISSGDRKANVARTFGATAATYDSVIPFFAHWGARLVHHAQLQVGERVLDVCCGTGASLFGAASAVGMAGSVVGVDLAPEMVAAARAAAGRLEATNVTVEVGDAEALDFDDESFDAVLCGFGIMFLPSPAAGLREMVRVLRPGGRIVLSVPQADLPTAAALKDRWRAERGIPSPGGPPGDPAVLLAEAGAPGAVMLAEIQDFTFDDGQAYVEWCRTHGARALLDTLEPDDAEVLIGQLAEAAEADGLTMQAKARFWRATKPG